MVIVYTVKLPNQTIAYTTNQTINKTIQRIIANQPSVEVEELVRALVSQFDQIDQIEKPINIYFESNGNTQVYSIFPQNDRIDYRRKPSKKNYVLLQKAYQQYMQEELEINDTLPTYYEMCQSEEMIVPIAYTEDEYEETLVQKQVSYDVINEEEWYQYTTNQHTFTLRMPIDLIDYATYLATARFDEIIIEPDALTMDDIFAYESQATTYQALSQQQETMNYLEIERI